MSGFNAQQLAFFVEASKQQIQNNNENFAICTLVTLMDELHKNKLVELEIEAKRILGLAYMKKGNTKSFEENLREAIHLAKDFNLPTLQINCAFTLGMFLTTLKDRNDDALQLLEQCAALSSEPYLLKKVHQGIAHVFEEQGKFEQVIIHHRKSFQFATTAQEKGLTLSGLGACYHKMGRYENALSYLKEANGICPGEPTILCNLAIALQSSGQIEEAIKDLMYILDNLSITEHEKIAILTNLANCLESLGKYSESMQMCSQVTDLISDNNNNIPYLAKINFINANNYAGMGNAMKSIEFAQQALHQSTDNDLHVKILNCLGNSYMQLGNFHQANKHLQEALSISQGMNNKALEALVTSNIADIYQMLGRTNTAKIKYREALKLAVESGDTEGQAQAYNCLGICFRHLNKFDKGLEMHNRSLEMYQRIGNEARIAQIYGNRGIIFAQKKQFNEALDEHRKNKELSRKLNDKAGECAANVNIGTIFVHFGKPDPALVAFEEALTVCQRDLKDKMRELDILSNIVTIHILKHQFAEAENTLMVAEKVVEDIWQFMEPKDELRISFFDNTINLYCAKQQLCIRQQKIEDALLAAEQCRSRALLKELGIPFHGHGNQLRESIRDHNATAVYYSLVAHPIQTAQGEFKKEMHLYVWLAAQDPKVPLQFVSRKLSSIEQLHQLIESVISCEADSSFRKVSFKGGPKRTLERKNFLKQLYDILIEPIKDCLPNSKDDLPRIIFVPQGLLFLVPFPALIDSNNCYLAEKYLISVIPSLHCLEITLQSSLKVQNTEKYLIVGNPIMPRKDLCNLPHSQIEAECISSLLKTECKIGKHATKSYVLNNIKQSRFVHLATHGILDEIQPHFETYLSGGIALACTQKSKMTPEWNDDDFLWAHEIQSMDLSGTEMVVLSACNTGRGEITTDGIIGLFRAFIIAQVPTIVASLWSVHDDATKQLMVEFYANLIKGKNKVLAMHEAMKVIRSNDNTSDPIFWAGFAIFGE